MPDAQQQEGAAAGDADGASAATGPQQAMAVAAQSQLDAAASAGGDGNSGAEPAERKGFVLPYQLGRARRFARPYWFIPDDLV